MITKFKNFNYSINEIAWLYFLHIICDKKMKILSWKDDIRMGISCDEALSKFPTVTENDGNYVSSDGSLEIIDRIFKCKTFEEAILSQKENIIPNISYNINNISYDYFLRKHPNIEKAFDKIDDAFVDHFNSQQLNSRLIDKISKMRHINKWNFKELFNIFGKIPEKIKLYRGIKSEYDPERNMKYSCWTSDEKEAIRFATYIFNGKYQKPIYADISTVLETEVDCDDIVVVFSSDESEFILKDDINIKNIRKL